MKALVTRKRDDGKREKLLMDWEDHPSASGNLIKTKTLYSGVTNGTERNDLTAGNYATPEDQLPKMWGYQNVGKVVEVGPEVESIQVGDVVYSSANHEEYALFPEGWLYAKLPEGFDLKQAAILGMTSVAMRTCRHADIRMGERVLVVGGGIIGQTAAQIANVMGGQVTLCDINEERLGLAREIGAAEHVVNVEGDKWSEEIADFGYDAVIDVAGVPGMEDKLVQAVAFRGRIMFIAGRHRIDYDFNVGQGHEVTIKQNSHFDVSDLENMVRLVHKGQVRFDLYLRDIVPVTEAKGIYDTLRDDPGKLLGTVFDWQVLEG